MKRPLDRSRTHILLLFARVIPLLCISLILTVPGRAPAQNLREDPEAREIFNELDRRRDKISHAQANMQMIIYDSRGRTRHREIRFYEYHSGETDKSLMVFESPANVRGTAFLTLSEGSREDQKLYLPALDRVQVISASEKSDRFMGSDFTYEDLGDQDPGDYRFQMMEETVSSYVLKAEKKGESQYAWLHFYIDPERYVLQQVEYFDADGTMIKRLEAGDYQKVMEDVWRPNVMVMYDLEHDRKTELNWSNRIIGKPEPAWRFTERGMRRGTGI